MPHRIQLIELGLFHIIQGAILASVFAWNGTKAIFLALTESDWTRMMGPHGVAAVCILAVSILWATLVTYIVKAERRAARFHVESIGLYRENAESLKEMIYEQFKASGIVAKSNDLVAQSNLKVEHAINSMSNSITHLTIKVTEKCPNAQLLEDLKKK